MTELENEKTDVAEQAPESDAFDAAAEAEATEVIGVVEAEAQTAAFDEAAGEGADALDVPQADEVEELQAEAADAVQADAISGEEPIATAEEPADRNDEVAPKQKTGIGDLVAIGILSLIMVVLMCLPSFLGSSSSTPEGGHDLSGGTAATVNGTEIGENDIANEIMRFRTAQGLTAEEDWGKWMASAGYTTESLRQDVANSLVARELVNQAAAEYGVEVSGEEIDAAMSKTVETVGGEERMAELLAQDGITVDEYRQSIASSLKQQALASKVVETTEPLDDQMVLEYVKMFYPDDVDQDVQSLDGIDSEKVDSVRTMLEQSQLEQAYVDWMNEYASKADVQINPMPENLPYYVDTEKYQAEADLMNEMALGDYDEGDDAEGSEEDGDVVEVLADDEQAEGEK